MNMFIFEQDFSANARAHPDILVNKMITESLQVLATRCYQLGLEVPLKVNAEPYKRTHENHRLTRWLGTGRSAWITYCNYAKTLANEFARRYQHPHNSMSAIAHCIGLTHAIPLGEDLLPPPCVSDRVKAEIPALATDAYTWAELIAGYRSYLLSEKAHYATWRYTEPPQWWQEQAPAELFAPGWAKFCKLPELAPILLGQPVILPDEAQIAAEALSPYRRNRGGAKVKLELSESAIATIASLTQTITEALGGKHLPSERELAKWVATFGESLSPESPLSIRLAEHIAYWNKTPVAKQAKQPKQVASASAPVPATLDELYASYNFPESDKSALASAIVAWLKVQLPNGAKANGKTVEKWIAQHGFATDALAERIQQHIAYWLAN